MNAWEEEILETLTDAVRAMGDIVRSAAVKTTIAVTPTPHDLFELPLDVVDSTGRVVLKSPILRWRASFHATSRRVGLERLWSRDCRVPENQSYSPDTAFGSRS